MNSPTLSMPYANNLSLSAVYRNRQATTPTKQRPKLNPDKPESSPYNFSKSSVNEKEYPRKPDNFLRATMQAPVFHDQSWKNEKSNDFLRSTMNTNFTSPSNKDNEQPKPFKYATTQQPTPYYKKPYQDKQTTDLRKQYRYNQNEKDNYGKIVHRIDKKQKLISELKALSEAMVAETALSSNELNRKDKRDADAFRKYEPIITEASKTTGKDDYREMLSKSSHSTNANAKNKINLSFNSIKDKMMKKKGISELEEAVRNKNPQEDIYRKNVSSLYSPRMDKPIEIDLKTENDKKWNVKHTLKSYNNINDYNTSSNNDHLYNSSYTSLKYNNDSSPAISPAKTKTNNSQPKSFRKPTLNDFQLKKTLGQGKFGKVYMAIHKQTKGLFALKRISKKIIKEHYLIDQFVQQIKIQNYCDHENILRLYGFFDDDDADHIYLILEFMEQGTLFFQLKKSKTQTLNQLDVATKMKQLAEGIHYLHEKGVVHRDIKPENIVMTHGVSKLCDFGWAAICTERRKTYCGTFDYISPEILEGTDYDTSVDLWCLGILTYELLVGKAPFYHISRKQTMKKILNVQSTAIDYPSHLSKTAVSFIESLLKKNPEERMTGQDLLRHPFLTQVKDKPA